MFFPAFGADSVVRLPQFTVTDSRLLPKPESWRLLTAPGFEVLSNAPDRTTQQVVRDLAEFSRAVALVWPAVRPGGEMPVSLVLCGRGDKFAEFMPAGASPAAGGSVSLSLRDRERAALVLNLEARTLQLSPAEAADGGSGEIQVDATQELHREYVRFLLRRAEPAPAPWLEEGLAELFTSMEYDRNEIVFGRLPDAGEVTPEQAAADLVNGPSSGPADPEAVGLPPVDGGPPTDKAFNAFLARHWLMPLGRMFAVRADSPEARNPVGGLWAKQCWAFVHLCLYGERQRYQKAFLAFVTRAAREGESEALFRECFKMSYHDMLIEIRGYAETTDYRSYGAKNLNLPSIPEFPIREASEAEVGRIKGEALALAGRKEAAHYTLLAPYVRGSRDPDLMAALGLEELAGGDAAHARPLLEAAVAQKTSRARAYVELGRLRLADALARPAAPGGQLAPGQLTAVLAPLMAARQLPPALPETFETIAESLLCADVKLSREDLGVVTAGVVLFPSDSELAYRDARLHAAQGYGADAARLARFGAANAADPAARARFIRLADTLPRGD